MGAVCVYPARVEDAVRALKEAGAAHIPVASGMFDPSMKNLCVCDCHAKLSQVCQSVTQ